MTAFTALVFDWGNTLMVNHPFTGPMATWPRVEAIPAARQTLEQLAGNYRLALATNAGESDASLVKAALQRVGLDGHLEYIFTPHELNGARKPERVFFMAIEQTLGVPRSQLVMIGDDPIGDVAGAVLAGWQAVWLNLQRLPAPGSLPLHGAEINALEELPSALEQLTLPTIEQAQTWLLEQGATANLLVHVEMVAALAYHIARWLRAAGEKVDPILAHRGGLLHDLAKIAARGKPLNHGELGSKLLTQMGHPELARIASSHMLFNILAPEKRPLTWEEKLIYYADKLVEKGQIVSIQTRMQALCERYNIPSREADAVSAAMHALEDEICTAMGFTPIELLARLQQAFIEGSG